MQTVAIGAFHDHDVGGVESFRRVEDSGLLAPEIAAKNQLPAFAGALFANVQLHKRSAENMPSVVKGQLDAVRHQKLAVRADADKLAETGLGTRGTAAALAAAGVAVTPVNKVAEGRPHIVDMIKNDEIAMVVNTVEEKRSAIQDSYAIRRAALTDEVPTYTTLAGFRAAAIGIRGMRALEAASIQALHARLAANAEGAREAARAASLGEAP